MLKVPGMGVTEQFKFSTPFLFIGSKSLRGFSRATATLLTALVASSRPLQVSCELQEWGGAVVQ